MVSLGVAHLSPSLGNVDSPHALAGDRLETMAGSANSPDPIMGPIGQYVSRNSSDSSWVDDGDKQTPSDNVSSSDMEMLGVKSRTMSTYVEQNWGGFIEEDQLKQKIADLFKKR